MKIYVNLVQKTRKTILNYYGMLKPGNENKEVIRCPRCGTLNRTQLSSKDILGK